MYETLVDYNDCNNAPFSNDNIWQAKHIFIAEEESYAHNVTADTFCQSTVTQEDILTGESQNNSDGLAETVKGLTINEAGYYISDKNYAEGNPKSDPKVATYITNRNLPQNH